MGVDDFYDEGVESETIVPGEKSEEWITDQDYEDYWQSVDVLYLYLLGGDEDEDDFPDDGPESCSEPEGL